MNSDARRSALAQNEKQFTLQNRNQGDDREDENQSAGFPFLQAGETKPVISSTSGASYLRFDGKHYQFVKGSNVQKSLHPNLDFLAPRNKPNKEQPFFILSAATNHESLNEKLEFQMKMRLGSYVPGFCYTKKNGVEMIYLLTANGDLEEQLENAVQLKSWEQLKTHENWDVYVLGPRFNHFLKSVPFHLQINDRDITIQKQSSQTFWITFPDDDDQPVETESDEGTDFRIYRTTSEIILGISQNIWFFAIPKVTTFPRSLTKYNASRYALNL